MKYTSQNNETEVVLNYFGGFKGTVLEIGANDGHTLSNSYDLIKAGWKGVLVEPSSVFDQLEQLYIANPDVQCLNIAIGSSAGEITFFESGAHVRGGADKALVSTTVFSQTERWRQAGVKFTEKKVPVFTFSQLDKHYGNKKFEYISIDVEGLDFEILQQIDLTQVGCQAICLEWNGYDPLGLMFTAYCRDFGLKEISRNRENIIFAR